MGQKQSSPSSRANTLRPNKRDEPYVTVLMNPECLDWKRHVQVTHPQSKESVIMERNVQHINLPAAIDPNYLYISDAKGVSNIAFLKNELGITHVLNVGGSRACWLPLDAYEKAGLQYKLVDAFDEPAYRMLDYHLEECRAFIQDARESGGKVVVHCQAGMNRSGVIVAAEYMIKHQQNVLETILHCRTCRGNWFLVDNHGFARQLVALARREGLLGPAPGEPGCLVPTSKIVL